MFLEEYDVFFGIMNTMRKVWNFNINIVIFALHISSFLEKQSCMILQSWNLYK